MRKIDKFIVELCFDVFGHNSGENKRKLKKAVAETEMQNMIEQLSFGEIEYSEIVKEVKKRFETPKFFNIPALSAVQDLFFDEKTELKFRDKAIESKDGTVFYTDDGKEENQFFNSENYLLYILMFTFSERKTNIEELYRFCISSNSRINTKNLEEFEEKIVDLASQLSENEVVVNWHGKSSLLLSKFEKSGSELYFDCSKFKQMLGNKIISIPQKLIGKSKFSVVFKKLMIIKEIRDWKRFGNKFSSRVIVNRIEHKLNSEISNEFLKQFLKHLKENGFIGEYQVKTQNFAKCIVFEKSNQKVLTPYTKNGITIAYYLKGSIAKKIIGKYYSKANYHLMTNKVRFDDNNIKLTEEEKERLTNYIYLNLKK